MTARGVLPASHWKAARVAERLAPGVRAASESGHGRASDWGSRTSSLRDTATPAGATGGGDRRSLRPRAPDRLGTLPAGASGAAAAAHNHRARTGAARARPSRRGRPGAAPLPAGSAEGRERGASRWRRAGSRVAGLRSRAPTEIQGGQSGRSPQSWAGPAGSPGADGLGCCLGRAMTTCRQAGPSSKKRLRPCAPCCRRRLRSRAIRWCGRRRGARCRRRRRPGPRRWWTRRL